MMRTAGITLGTLLLLGRPMVAAAANVVIDGVFYVESGQSETVTATFLTPDGGITAGQYSGFVKLTVSGSGESFFSYLNDAFYLWADNAHNPIQPYYDPSHYQLTESDTTLVGAGAPGYDTQQAYHKIFFDIDGGFEVSPDYRPPYRPDHTYQVVIDTGLAAPGNLHFGVADGNFSDNSGSYTIVVSQLGECFAVTGEQITCQVDGTTFTYEVEGSTCSGAEMSFVFTGSGGAPGESMCFSLVVSGPGGFCCVTNRCVTVPDCQKEVAGWCDLDGDGSVGILDFLTLLGQWGTDPGGPPDFDGDGEVGVVDFLTLLGHWGPVP